MILYIWSRTPSAATRRAWRAMGIEVPSEPGIWPPWETREWFPCAALGATVGAVLDVCCDGSRPPPSSWAVLRVATGETWEGCSGGMLRRAMVGL